MSTIFDKIVDGEVILPVGEIEGPFTITKPCRVTGNNTTIWARSTPVLTISCPGVTLQNVRVEVTEGNDNNVALLSSTRDTVTQNCEVFGKTSGFGAEDNTFDIPRMLKLGEFAANEENTFAIEVFVSNPTKIKNEISGLTFTPDTLNAGYNRIVIKTDKLKDKTCIYGEIVFRSDFNRRTYINGKAVNDKTKHVQNKSVYSAKRGLSSSPIKIAPVPTAAVSSIISAPSMPRPDGLVELMRGQRAPIGQALGNNAKILFDYNCSVSDMEIDPYVFLLDANGKTLNDESLVFFGNIQSPDGSVKYNDLDASFEIDFSKVSPAIKRIEVTYAIYGDNPSNNFSKVHDPVIRILSKGTEKFRYKVTDLLTETTIVAVEFYRFNSEWKINTIGSGYRNGLKRLCESFGLVILS